MKTFTIPGTDIEYSISDKFASAEVKKVTSSILEDDAAFHQFKRDPVKGLSDLGIVVSKEQLDKISPAVLGQIYSSTKGAPIQQASVAMVITAIAACIY
ncbi:hypothetical protein [Bradyrhizobium roseum]|uniref:hypothetical protein n=1 Tax=Bradyrhizobium roseum TaxID=3056648 RepID=UPI00262195CD|nr:hypothetical protein [Bradyrhizobium roseus]WKA26390.1 hypothetical protein QUH67_22640 [Bradyrhizobium roseus]